ncbi:hypothetical protein MUY40_29055 [Blautia sp. NSJ-159]|uniref:hypothetical protein n=1 Tax=unclassified Blautia TaxID=2648079 RepID=UPI001FD0B399|nr:MULTISPECIES: hypothetical protein [unclassified Blautia]MCJ8020985.1 hypothetical protein [Blautia sp. NSJ-159]MCJ8043912.1 hypothetical protein [Blautia sp. NSJ-165]
MLDEKVLKSIADLLNSQTNMILNELDNVQLRLTDKMNRLESNMDELKQYYRINKLENENTSLLLQMIKDLQKEVEELKKKIA